jgi:hypothetical protein
VYSGDDFNSGNSSGCGKEVTEVTDENLTAEGCLLCDQPDYRVAKLQEEETPAGNSRPFFVTTGKQPSLWRAQPAW